MPFQIQPNALVNLGFFPGAIVEGFLVGHDCKTAFPESQLWVKLRVSKFQPAIRIVADPLTFDQRIRPAVALLS